MAKRTGPTNIHLKELIIELKKNSISHNSNLWKRIAKELSKPTRVRRIVNLSRINRHTKENENIIVPGKVLASGDLDHKLTIAAWQFSEQALDTNSVINTAFELAFLILSNACSNNCSMAVFRAGIR